MNPPDILSAVVEFQPTEPVPLQQESTGEVIHSTFLQTLRAIDATAFAALHADRRRKPFTVSAIFDGRSVARGCLEAGRTYWFRITALSAAAARQADTVLRQLCAAPFRLFDRPVQVTGVHTQGHPWARASSAATFLAAHLRAEAPVATRMGLQFCTPARFETEDRPCGFFPEPGLVFRHLADTWVAHTGNQAGATVPMMAAVADAAALAEKVLLISRYDLRTEPVYFRGNERRGVKAYAKIGYVGSIEYVAAKHADPLALCVLHLLATYSFFAGVGYHTTMGMGQVMPFWPRSARARRSGGEG